MIICNVRNLQSNTTGVQRYTSEILKQIGRKNDIGLISPPDSSFGLAGHMWEQFVLPIKLKNKLLWSPANTGPLVIRDQVVSIHDCSPLDHPEWSSRKFSSWYQFLLPRLMRNAIKVITVSEFSKSRILHFCPEIESKVEVTLLGVEDRFTPASQVQIRGVIERLRIPSANYILALGSIEPRKNLKSLLLAWDKVNSKLPNDLWLVIAGAHGSSLVFGEQVIERLPPRVFLTGYVPDEELPALYSGAIASAYLSLYEGFGLPPLESIACGTPVIASNAGPIPEVMGGSSMLVNPCDIDEICHNILTLAMDSGLRAKLSARGLERARNFSWKKTALRTYDILQDAKNL